MYARWQEKGWLAPGKNLGANPPRITERVPGLVVDAPLQALAFWMM